MQPLHHPSAVDRRPVVGVMGSHKNSHTDRSKQVGVWIARQGYHLLTGGGEGVMSAVTEAFVRVTGRQGAALGVVPSILDDRRSSPVQGYPNAWVEIPIYTHLDVGGPIGDEPTSRNPINVLTSMVVILLPGGVGTAGEARLTRRYSTPCVAYLRSADEILGLPEEIPVESDFARVAEFVSSHAARGQRSPGSC